MMRRDFFFTFLLHRLTFTTSLDATSDPKRESSSPVSDLLRMPAVAAAFKVSLLLLSLLLHEWLSYAIEVGGWGGTLFDLKREAH